VLGSNSRISSDSERQLLSSRQPGNLFAKPNTLVDIARPIIPSSQTAVERQLPFAGAYLGTASNICAESSMTIRFRAAEADELVDDERAVQRIYIASAMTMEPGEFYCFLEQAPIPNPMQLPAACLPLLPVNASRSPLDPSIRQASNPHPSALILQPSLPMPPLPVRCPQQWLSLASTIRSAAMLETGLLVSSLAGLVRLYRQDTCTRVRCNVGHPALVSRARSPVYKGRLCTAHVCGVILAVHRIACRSSWPIANVSI
jgi:hypothetical protein